MILLLVLEHNKRTMWSNVVSLSHSALSDSFADSFCSMTEIWISEKQIWWRSDILTRGIANNSLWDASLSELRIDILEVRLGIIWDTGGGCVCVLMTVIWGRSHGVTNSSPLSEWFIAVFAFVNSLDLCTVKKQTSCGMADKTSTWILTNTEWKDCNRMLFFLPLMPVSMFYHYRHGNCEKPPLRFSVFVILDDLERCFAFCKSKILIFLYPLTCIERFYSNLIRGLFFFF